MDERKYNVVFKGEIHEQATLSLVQERLASIFKADIESIKIIFSKKRTIVKKNVSYELCQKVEQGFLNAGAYVDIEEIIPEVLEPETIEPVPESGYIPEPEYISEPEPEYAPESEYIPEPDPEYGSEPDSEYPPVSEPSEPESTPGTEYLSDPDIEYTPEVEEQQEFESEYAPESEYITEPEPEPEPEIVQPDQESEEYDPEFDSDLEPDNEEPVESDEADVFVEQEDIVPSFEMENEPEKVVPIPDEEIDEPSFGYAPLPEYKNFTDSDSELEPEFEIVEDESESAFDMQEVESELEADYDEEYEFAKMESVDIEEDSLADESVENPYAAPHANLEQRGQASDKNFVHPRKLPLKSGLNWLLYGLTLFKINPFKWIASVFLFMLISTIAGLIPFLGAVVSNLVNPVFMAGFILGAKEQDEGGNFKIGHVFAGFSNNFGQLILFGLLYSVITLAVFGLIGIIFVLIFVAGGLGSMNFADPSSFAALANISPILILLIILVGMLITIPIMMAYYFGPALISVNQVSIFDSVKLSFRACLSNMLPFFVYGIACLGILAVAVAVIGGIAVLIGMMSELTGIIVGIIGMVVIIFTIMPVFIASTYAAYKDIFYTK